MAERGVVAQRLVFAGGDAELNTCFPSLRLSSYHTGELSKALACQPQDPAPQDA